MAKKKLYVKTYGCQMNVYDSMKMADIMKPLGYEAANDMSEADMIILNTCHIREKAAEKVYSELGRINILKNKLSAQGKNITITVAGCVSQAEGDEIFRRAPYVDIVVGPQSYQNLPDLISKLEREKGKVINLEFEDDKFDKLPGNLQDIKNGTACIAVQEGCDKFCTFCVVPYTRGAEYSRPVEKIYREALSLVAAGALEITLLGQNVNAYHGIDEQGKIWNLGELIKLLANIKQLKRIRYSTSHPRDMHEALYDMHKNEAKLMPFLNLPVQSGSNKILKAMNRKHKREDYFAIIDRLKKDNPDLQFSSDFIIGFPGETEQDFEDSLDLAQKVNFVQAYSFKYSRRPGTPGDLMEDQVDEDIKIRRLAIFQELISKQQIEFNRSCIDKEFEVLIDREGKKDNQLLGRSPYMQSVVISNAKKDLLGKIITVKIIGARINSLEAKLV